MVETSRQITPNRKERIEEIEWVAKTGKITTADRDKLIKKLSRKPSVFLAYLVLRKYSSAEHTMSRQDIKVVKVGKKGYYLLENGRFDYGELYFLLNAVNSSMRLSLHDKKRLIDKLLSMGIKSDDFNKLRQMQNSIHITAPERVEKKSEYLDVLTKIGEAVHTKQCITFKHGLT